MIDFGHFYQKIAVGSLSHCLETLPCQIEQWKKTTQHEQFNCWQKIVQNLPAITPAHLELKTAVIAKNELPLCLKDKQRITCM